MDVENLKDIVKIQLANFAKRLKNVGVEFSITDKAAHYLADVGFDPVYGARPLKRAIVKEIETPLSRMLIADELKKGDCLKVDVKDNKLIFTSI